MSKNKNGRLSVKTIIANVIRDLQLSDAAQIYDYMIEWAYEAEILIGSYDTFIRKECEISFKNNRSPLPRDFYKFISLKVGGSFPEVTNRDFRLFSSDSPNLAVKGNFNVPNEVGSPGFPFDQGEENRLVTKFNVDNGYINISSISNGVKGGLAYLAFDLDEEGFPLVKDGHQMAVTAYIIWKYKNAEYVQGKVTHHVYKELENRWYWLCGKARGDDEMPNPKQLEYIAAMYYQLLPTPSKNYF